MSYMWVILISVVVFVLTSTITSTPTNINNYHIYNGHEIKAGDKEKFPYQVGLLLRSGQWCGGSLISHDFVLTAAHCLFREVGSLKIYMGSVVRILTNKVDVLTKNIYINKYYRPETGDNDIALIKIPYVNFNEEISPISLPDTSMRVENYYGKDVLVSGWGAKGGRSRIAENINYGIMSIITKDECKLYHNSTILRSSNICVTPKYHQSDCNGDSGGPAVLVDEKIQVGIVSRGGAPQCNSTLPNLYTNVLKYRSWIANIAGI